MNAPLIPSAPKRLMMGALAGILAGAGVILTSSTASAATPSSPIGVHAAYTQGTSQATISWDAPVDNAPASTYVVRSQPTGLECTTTALKCVVRSLVPGTTYDFVVTAHNTDGTGPTSNPSENITVTALPGVVGALTLHYVQGATGFEATWNQPTTGYPAPNYLVALNSGTPVLTASTYYSFSSLSVGSVYQVSVTATNSVGEGKPTYSSDVTITRVPSAPRNVAVVVSTSATTASVRWAAPLYGYPAAYSYAVTATPAASPCTTTTTSCLVSGLVPGTTYTFSVVATNTAGTSAAALSKSVLAEPAPSAPGAPVFAVPAANTNAVTLTWSPSSNCSQCIYSVYYKGKSVGTTGATRIRLTGLDWDATYTFSIVATNAAGQASVASPASAGVTPWRTRLHAGETVVRGQLLYSPNKTYALSVTTSGYLTITHANVVTWVRGGARARRLSITKNADLVLTGIGALVWSSHTRVVGAFFVTLGNNGRLEIFHAGRAIWHS